MTPCPAVPRAGDPVSATWMANLVRYIKSIRPLQGPNIRLAQGPNGTVITATAAVGNRRGGASADMGCWKIVQKEMRREDDGTDDPDATAVYVTYPSLGNRYWLMGEVVRSMDENEYLDLSSFVMQGELSDGEEYTDADRPYICLKVPAAPDSNEQAEVIGLATLEEVQETQKDMRYVTKLLYKLSHDCAVVVDFRNMPALQVTEVVA